MKKVYNILGIILSIALLWSCSSDFIDKDPIIPQPVFQPAEQSLCGQVH